MKKYAWTSTIKINLFAFKSSGFWPTKAEQKQNFYTFYTLFPTIVFGFVHYLNQTFNLSTNLDDIDITAILKMHHFGRNIETFKKLVTIVKRSLFQRRSLSQIALVIPNLDIWKLLYTAVDLDITLLSRIPLHTNCCDNQAVSDIILDSVNVNLDPLIALSECCREQRDNLADNLKARRLQYMDYHREIR
jgi:hypothetical protein